MKTPSDNSPESPNTQSASASHASKAYTPKKGRPTPTRKEAEVHAGSFRSRYSPNESWSEDRKKRKELKASMSKEEWKDYKKKQADASKQRRREAQLAMDSGDERYLLPRDRGEERRYIRNLVDSKRYINNLMMPLALALLVVMLFGNKFPAVAAMISTGALVVILVFLLEGILLGRKAARMAREKFPHTSESAFSLGFYAYGRATQPRRWRTPKPQVNIGDKVS
ncbi:hypothetical protein CIP107570_01511 [Corynebacterium diphtheriae]|nr:hypothetical protein CIP107570_01511 [Corynebacterium diphtheriae]